jgi:type II secretory pathway component PulF
MAQSTIFENLGRIFFTRERILNLEGETRAAGMDVQPEPFAGYIAANVIGAAFILTLVLMLYPPTSSAIVSGVNGFLPFSIPGFIIALPLLAVMLALIYLTAITLLETYLIMRTETRRNALETALPDFLTLVASNIKAGMTLDQAMWYSAKPEFGLLSTEVKSIVKSSFSGESMENSLDMLASRFDSKVFTRTISLIKQASETGGELTEVLERTAEDVRNTSIMKKEIAASLVLYEIFVIFAAVVGTPFLFAVSQKLVEVFEKISPQIPSSGNAGGLGGIATFSFSGPVITSQQFFYFTIPTIIVTSIFSAFMVSAIRTGTRSQGLKYFPFMLAGALLIYWLVSLALGAFFSTLA